MATVRSGVMKEWQAWAAYFQAEAYQPVKKEEAIMNNVKISDKILADLEKQGIVVIKEDGRIHSSQQLKLEAAKIQLHPKGFAFARVEGRNYDVYISEKDLKYAMNQDRVLIKVTNHPKDASPEGYVYKIIERTQTRVVGTYFAKGKHGRIETDDKKSRLTLLVHEENRNGAMDGHKVVADIIRYPDRQLSPEGRVVNIIGHKNDPGVDILSVIHKFGVQVEFPDEVLTEAAAIQEIISDADREGRMDFRNEVIFTIDGEDAKDLDDAVHVKKLENGHYLLGVHIADVSHYVTEGSELDKEAAERGTSVYLVDRVIPMIPHRLSNGICSLNPQVDRLTLSCLMEIDTHGQVVRYQLAPSVINTAERMTYTNVRKILEKEDQAVMDRYQPYVPQFDLMGELAHILNQKRVARGSIDFDLSEAKVLVDEAGKPLDIQVRERSVAEKLIEEFMLAANETVAEHFAKNMLPFIYRIHEQPNDEKINSFLQFLLRLGIGPSKVERNMKPKDIQQLLNMIKGEEKERAVNTLALRSMKQARYSEENAGHFGLANEFYTHFTSPIRRYPDLLVHRLLRSLVFEKETHRIDEWHRKIPEIAVNSSAAERVAVEMEREVDEMKKAEYMKPFVGEEFEATVSSLTNFGIFVQLKNTIEGLIHVKTLKDDQYRFDEEHQILIGKRTGKYFSLGDPVVVQLVKADPENRAIDFILSETFVQTNVSFNRIEQADSLKNRFIKKGEANKKNQDAKSSSKKNRRPDRPRKQNKRKN